jgi:Ca2+-binding RTX toxin-like protein
VFDASERIANSVPVVAGNNTLVIDAPAGISSGLSYARFRVSSAGGLGPTGLAVDGEVEDYAVQLNQPTAGSVVTTADPLNPGQSMLVVQGTGATDSIVISAIPFTGLALVTMSGYGTVPMSGYGTVPMSLSGLSRIVIFGEGGSDAIVVDNSIATPVYAYGDAGNDTITGGGGDDYLYGGSGIDTLNGNSGNDVLLGEGDVDTLFGGLGRDVLIGGSGLDTLRGEDGDDILIGGNGPTSYLSLESIKSAWLSSQPFTQRVATLSAQLNSSTVLDDGVMDLIYGNGGSDWQIDFQNRDLFLDYLVLHDRKN